MLEALLGDGPLGAHAVSASGAMDSWSSHNSCRYDVNNCLVVCNPRGYPMGRLSNQFENDTFDPGLLLEQSPTGLWQVCEI